jgi:hypothetical protein
MGQLVDIRRVEVGPRTMTANVHIAEGAPLYTSDDPEGTNRVLALLPGIADHVCVGDSSERFGEVVRDTEVAHLLEHVSVELMALTQLGGDISAGRTRAGESEGDYVVELDCPDDVLTAACLSSAAWVLDWAYSGGADPVPDIDATVSGLVALVSSVSAAEGDGSAEPEGEPSVGDDVMFEQPEVAEDALGDDNASESESVGSASPEGEDTTEDDGRDR